MHEVDVVVIGAGAAGVAAARRLAAAQIRTVVLEARSRVGGRAWTMRGEGLPLDLGCGWLHSADENEWAAVATTLGLALDRTPPPWGTRRSTVGFPPDELADFRDASDRFFERLHGADPAASDRPASDFLEPGNRWNALINSLSTYISGVELDQVSVHDLNNYHDSGENWRVVEGYGALVEAFAAPLDVRLDCPATAIDHSGKQLRIATPKGDIRAHAAIIAVPTSMLAREAPRFVPALPDKLAAAAKLPLGLDDKFFLHIDRPDDIPVETRLFGVRDRPLPIPPVRPAGDRMLFRRLARARPRGRGRRRLRAPRNRPDRRAPRRRHPQAPLPDLRLGLGPRPVGPRRLFVCAARRCRGA